ncbi:MAG TPA: alpha/beta fold hydrolase [Anaeromyxobacteraceae bacterium]|nr:alpha/beta fold hydrolase [Anaeromyxobacteraceae bacterium]
MKSLTVDLDGPVHYADFGGSGRPIVLVHGLGGSHLNWLPVGKRLAAHGRVLAIDLAGHGRTPSLGRTARIGANLRLLGRFLEAVAGASAVLVGNSMGGYLAMAEAAAEPHRVDSLVLVDPAVPNTRIRTWDPLVVALFTAYALPGTGAAMMLLRGRRGAERLVRATLALCCVDASRVSPETVQAHVELARERLASRAGRDFLAAQRSLMARLIRPRRFYRMVAGIRARALIVQGGSDRLVRVEAARVLAAARPDWRFELLEGVGHVPQLEAPERFLAAVEPWLRAPEPRRSDAAAPRRAAGSARRNGA